MKYALSIVLFLFLFVSVMGQNVYIPDPNFRAFLQSEYPNCMDGDSLDSQCSQVIQETEIVVSSLNISDLEGLQAFVSLTDLVCTNNPLNGVPDLPVTLERFDCSSTMVESLPQLPESLRELFSVSCQLTTLPFFPDGLEKLWVNNNQISFMPDLPESLIHLECRNNNLNCIPPVPNGLEELAVLGNDLNCLPELPVGAVVDLGLAPCVYLGMHHCTAKPVVTGKVFYDANENCNFDSEIGLKNRVVQSSEGVYGISDEQGYYQIFSDSGNFVFNQLSEPSFWNTSCSGIPHVLNIDAVQDTISNVNFPNQSVESCHWLWVDLNSSNQRPCFTTNSYAVSYCNYGTEGAQDAYVELTFPPAVIPLNSSIPWQQMGGGVYRFEVGDLAIDECGSFNITDSVSCDAVVGSTVCVTAEIFPVNPCLIATAQPGWDNSSIEVTGICNGTSVDFLIENVGSGDMTSQSNYQVYQDNALLEEGQISALIAGSSTTISQLADGAAYRLEVDQSAGHPGVSLPRATVEGCGIPFSLGQVNISQQDDMGDHIEINCTELTASYDPNDKRVVPAGYGSEHIVHPNDSLLEYTIRFQNTGSDTAFTVEVVDTLPTAYLNPITFLSGASSHPYSVRMHGNGIVTWRFEDILLPDSATNEAGSQGFVKFKIKTRPDLPNGTVINNRANIYFDFNVAIVTETCFITISDMEIIASDSEIVVGELIEIYPNPTADVLFLRIMDNELKGTGIKLFDITGREVIRVPFTEQLDVSGLSAGNYILSLYTNRGIHRKKVVIQ